MVEGRKLLTIATTLFLRFFRYCHYMFCPLEKFLHPTLQHVNWWVVMVGVLKSSVVLKNIFSSASLGNLKSELEKAEN